MKVLKAEVELTKALVLLIICVLKGKNGLKSCFYSVPSRTVGNDFTVQGFIQLGQMAKLPHKTSPNQKERESLSIESFWLVGECFGGKLSHPPPLDDLLGWVGGVLGGHFATHVPPLGPLDETLNSKRKRKMGERACFHAQFISTNAIQA